MKTQFPTDEAVFSHDFVVTPESCDARAALSPLGVFTMFQSIATQHAERLGVGGAAMAKRGAFWLTVHNRVDFYDRAYLMQTVRASTWAEACAEKDVRCFRSYTLRCGDKLVAVGRTQWAVLGAAGRVVPFGQSGFPQDYPFPQQAAIDEKPQRFHDDFAPEDAVETYTVRSTDIDMGRHMNNVAYVRLLLGQFSAKQLASGAIRSIELHYGAPCLEGEALTVYRRQTAERTLLAVGRPDGKKAVLAAVTFSEG